MRLPLNPFRSPRDAAEAPLRRLSELVEPPGSAGPDESPSRPSPSAPDPSELRAAALLQKLPRPSSLSPAALGRIGAAIAEPPRRRLSLLLAPVAATAAVAVVIGAAIPSLWRSRTAAPESLSLRELRLPPGGLARLDGASDSAVLAVGPAVLHQDAAAPGLVLDEGRLLVRAGAGALTLRVGRSAVTVPPRHVGEVVAHLGELVRVAAYVGDSGLRRELPSVRELTVSEGSVWTEQGLLAVPAGCRAAVERAWQPGPMALPACEPELAVVTPPPATMPAAPAAPPPPLAAEPLPTLVPAAPRPGRPAVRPAVAPSRPVAVGQANQAGQAAAPASLLAEESRLLGAALHQLRQERDAAAALRTLDQYQGRFPSGSLLEEAQAARVDALLQLERRTEALAVLDGARFQRLPRGGELLLLRGELRAAAGRCREADGDFLAALDGRPTAPVSERALYGRASCRARLGDGEGARQLLQQVLARFPTGRYAEPARRALQTLGASP